MAMLTDVQTIKHEMDIAIVEAGKQIDSLKAMLSRPIMNLMELSESLAAEMALLEDDLQQRWGKLAALVSGIGGNQHDTSPEVLSAVTSRTFTEGATELSTTADYLAKLDALSAMATNPVAFMPKIEWDDEEAM